MSETVTEKAKVKGLGKYGFQTVDGEWISWSKNLADSEKGKVVPGGEYEFVFYVADSGKRYVNSLKSLDVPKAAAKTEAKPAPKAEPAKREEPKATMSKEEWQAKDRSQLIGGLSHDAAAVTAALVTVEGLKASDALKVYTEVLKGMLTVRESLK